jgi:hypothetical protein
MRPDPAAQPKGSTSDAMPGGADGLPRARSHCRFAPPSTRLIPESLTHWAPLFLKRQCDRTPGLHLPPGTVKKDRKRWEEWLLPPTAACPPPKPGELVPTTRGRKHTVPYHTSAAVTVCLSGAAHQVATAEALPEWACRALRPIEQLNRLQSLCFGEKDVRLSLVHPLFHTKLGRH